MTAPAIKRPQGKGPAVQEGTVKKQPATSPSPTKSAPKTSTSTQESATAKKDNGKLSAKGLPCLCGCGQATKTDSAKFIPGHDARLKSVLLKVERGELPKSELTSILEVAKPFLQKSKMSGAWSFPTESGNTPDEDKHGKPYSERKEEVEAEKAAKKEKAAAKLAELKKNKDSKKSPTAKKPAPAAADDEDEEEAEEEEE